MIISHKYKYLFIENDQTASSAIANELVLNYGGERILWKHATYRDFLKIANKEEQKYFKFSGVRNPLDTLVSLYFKYMFDHRGRYSNKMAGVTKYNRKQYEFVFDNNKDFCDFFRKFYSNNIYYKWNIIDFDKLDFIYRYENLQEDFSSILETFGIKKIRPIPIVNPTNNKKNDYIKYYTLPILKRTKIVMNKFCKKWNYRFSDDWPKLSLVDYILYIGLNIKFAIKYLYHKII